MPLGKLHLGKILTDHKLISQEQLDKAMTVQQSTGDRLGKVLVNLGFITETKLLEFLSHQFKIPLIDIKNYELKPESVSLLPEILARRLRSIVLRDGDKVLVGMADPQDLVAYDELVSFFKKPIEIALVRERDLLDVLDMMYRRTTEISSLAQELSSELVKNDYDVSQLASSLSLTDAPVAKLLQSIFEDAVQVNASDVHIEPDEKVLRIRQRIDGILHEQIIKEKQIAEALTLRLKLMASLNIAEKRIPQDGRFSLHIRNLNYDVRLSTIPVQFGESVVMRLLNQSAELVNLNKVGIPPNLLTKLRRIIHYPNGLLLITGPTGSGKTTTLYAALTELNSAKKKIITVEDPVEYRIARINQVQVQPKIELTFAKVLRAVLRQDPDIIMVGELRDQETASIAIRASMTGHMVLSTLHTNDAVSSAIRLLDMGIEPYLVATVLRGIVAQRLVRRVCPNCSVHYELSHQEEVWCKAILKDKFNYFKRDQIKKGEGCQYCHHTGYKGQIGVFELLEMTSELADALRERKLQEFINIIDKDENYKNLSYAALEFVEQGITTVSEAMRITGESFTETPTPVN